MEENLNIQTVDAVELSLPVAGIGSRSYAFLIDWHIRLLLAMAWGLVMFFLAAVINIGTVLDGMGFNSGKIIGLSATIPILIIYFLYHPILEVLMKGKTPGKRMAGVRITLLTGETPGTGAILIRNIFRLIDCLPMFYILGLAVAIFSSRQVRVGDMAAGTVLIYDNALAKGSLDQIEELANHQILNPEQLSLLKELLERWRTLDKDARDRLGSTFLNDVSQQTGNQTDTLAPSSSDTDIYERLTELLNKTSNGD